MIGPEEAVGGTLNVSVPGEIVLKERTGPPPTVTMGAGDSSFRPVPVRVTTVPFVPEVGVKFNIVGRMRKSAVDIAGASIVPEGGDTVIFPVEAPLGTVNRIVVLLEIV